MMGKDCITNLIHQDLDNNSKDSTKNKSHLKLTLKLRSVTIWSQLEAC